MHDNHRCSRYWQVPWERYAWYLLPLTVLSVFGVTVYGLSHSDILTPWNPVPARQIIGLSIVVLIVSLGCLWASRAFRIRAQAVLTAAGGLTMVAAFGAAPVLLLGLFLFSAFSLAFWASRALPGATAIPGALLTTAGTALYIIVFNLLGPLPVNSVVLHSALLIVPSIIALAHPKFRLELGDRFRRWAVPAPGTAAPTAFETAGSVTFLLVAAIHVVLAALPERGFDAMAFHLYLASYSAAHRAWDYDAASYAFAFMPTAVDFIYTHFFILGGEAAAKCYNVATLLLLCACFHRMLVSITSREAATWTTVLLASMPLAFTESATLYIENTVALLVTAAMALLIDSELRPNARRMVMIFAVGAAASMAKLHGAIAAVVIGSTALFFFAAKRPPRRVLFCVLLACAVLGAIGTFPYAFAWIKTGNPLLPFYNNVFKSPFFPAYEIRDPRWEGHFTWSLLYDITFHSSRFLEATNDGALGLTAIVLFPLSIAAVIMRPRTPAMPCFLIGAFILFPIAMRIQYLRYFYPAFPILFVPAAAALAQMLERRATRVVTIVLLCAIAAFNLYKMPAGGWLLGAFDLRAAFDPSARRELELAQVPERIANRLVNDAAGPSARVLYTGYPLGALLEGRALYTNGYNNRLLKEMVEVSTPDQAKSLLLRWAVTHVIHTPSAEKPGQRAMGEYLASVPETATLGHVTVYDVRKALSSGSAR